MSLSWYRSKVGLEVSSDAYTGTLKSSLHQSTQMHGLGDWHPEIHVQVTHHGVPYSNADTRRGEDEDYRTKD